MGMSGISKSQASRFCEEIDEKVKAFLERPIEGEWPYLWIDTTYLKVRSRGRIISVAVIIAVGVNTDGRREVLIGGDLMVKGGKYRISIWEKQGKKGPFLSISLEENDKDQASSSTTKNQNDAVTRDSRSEPPLDDDYPF